MNHAKDALERRLNIHVDMLAWPFGIYDDDLIHDARRAGHIAGFTLDKALSQTRRQPDGFAPSSDD